MRLLAISILANTKATKADNDVAACKQLMATNLAQTTYHLRRYALTVNKLKMITTIHYRYK